MKIIDDGTANGTIKGLCLKKVDFYISHTVKVVSQVLNDSGVVSVMQFVNYAF